MPEIFETKLTFNSTGKAERKVRDGKTWLVVNGVLIKRGVHAGTSGAIFYSTDFIKKVAPKGNNRPIVNDHPVGDDGAPVAVNNGNYIDVAGVGELRDVKESKDDMLAKMWFDEVKTKKVNKVAYNAILKGKSIEVSTGFLLTVNEKAGEWEGTKYAGEAVDADFDHLAIVAKGACSNKNGCGGNITANCGNAECEDCKKRTQNAAITANDTSFSRIYGGLSDVMYRTFGYNYSIREVYPKFFIYRDGNGDLFKRTYAVNKDGDVSIGKDEPVKVKYVTEYHTDDGTFVGNSSQEVPVSKLNEHITALIANKDSGYEESDRDFLTKKGEEWCGNRVKTFTANKATEPPTPKKNDILIEKPDPKNWREHMTANGVPAEMIEMMEEGLSARDSARSSLIKAIVANKSNVFKEDYLKTLPLPQLQGIAALAGVTQTKVQPVGNYAGAATLDDIEEEEESEEPLGFTRPDFSKK